MFVARIFTTKENFNRTGKWTKQKERKGKMRSNGAISARAFYIIAGFINGLTAREKWNYCSFLMKINDSQMIFTFSSFTFFQTNFGLNACTNRESSIFLSYLLCVINKTFSFRSLSFYLNKENSHLLRKWTLKARRMAKWSRTNVSRQPSML